MDLVVRRLAHVCPCTSLFMYCGSSCVLYCCAVLHSMYVVDPYGKSRLGRVGFACTVPSVEDINS